MDAYKQMLDEPGAEPSAHGYHDADDDGSSVKPYTSCRGVKYFGHSCIVMDPHHPLRRRMIDMIDYGSEDPSKPSYFDFVVMTIISCSAFHLVCFDPNNAERSDTGRIELLLNVAYSVELLIVVTARGLIVAKHAYLQELWGWLDLTIVIAGWIPFFFEE
jgi:hypothetical protein